MKQQSFINDIPICLRAKNTKNKQTCIYLNLCLCVSGNGDTHNMVVIMRMRFFKSSIFLGTDRADLSRMNLRWMTERSFPWNFHAIVPSGKLTVFH